MASYECRGKKKLWSVRFDIIENNIPKTKRLSGFQRKKDAEQAYRDFMQEYNESLKKITPNKNVLDKKLPVLFSEYLIYKKDKIKTSSFYDTVNIYEKFIKSYFENFTIKNIDIQKWFKGIKQFI